MTLWFFLTLENRPLREIRNDEKIAAFQNFYISSAFSDYYRMLPTAFCKNRHRIVSQQNPGERITLRNFKKMFFRRSAPQMSGQVKRKTAGAFFSLCHK